MHYDNVHFLSHNSVGRKSEQGSPGFFAGCPRRLGLGPHLGLKVVFQAPLLLAEFSVLWL